MCNCVANHKCHALSPTTSPYRHSHRVVVVRFHSIVIANVNKLFMRHINCLALWQRRLWPQCVCEWETGCVYASDYLCQMAVNWISMFAVLTHTLPLALSSSLPSSLSLYWTCSPRLLFILIISWCQLILWLSLSLVAGECTMKNLLSKLRQLAPNVVRTNLSN